MSRALVVLILLVATKALAEKPVIRQPKDGAKVGARTVLAAGWVPKDRIGIFAVEPHNTAGTLFIQSFVPEVSGGDVSESVYLGQLNKGAKEWYRIYLLGCKAGHGLKQDRQKTFDGLRGVCVWSRSVTVYRER